MEKEIIKKGKLTTKDMLEELPIGICQLRKYLNDGRLKGKKVRNKFIVERSAFDDFKKKQGFC